MFSKKYLTFCCTILLALSTLGLNFSPYMPPPPPQAQFTYSINNGVSVTFSDQSTNSPTSWFWDFGNGLTSTLQNPVHVYPPVPGIYTVCLVAVNGLGRDTLCKQITLPCPNATPDFSFSINNNSVQFFDQSNQTVFSYRWSFPGGTPSSHMGQTPPPVTYNTAGAHQVKLVIETPCDKDSVTKTIFTGSGIFTMTIPQVQSPVDLVGCNDTSAYYGDTVRVRGVVVTEPDSLARSPVNQIWIQEQGYAYIGLEIMAPNAYAHGPQLITQLNPGDSVEITGIVEENNGMTSVRPLPSPYQAVRRLATNRPIYETKLNLSTLSSSGLLNNIQTGELYEGALINIMNSRVQNVNFFSGGSRVNFEITDDIGHAIAVVDRFKVMTLPGNGGTFVPPQVNEDVCITGILIHDKNLCTGSNGQGYTLNPFLAEHYHSTDTTLLGNDTIVPSSDTLTIFAGQSAGGVWYDHYNWFNGDTGRSTTIFYWPPYNKTVVSVWGIFNQQTCWDYGEMCVTFDTACVWPGDANYDLIANNFDLLSIGIAFNDSGPARPSADTTWTCQAAWPWDSTFASGRNYKHADCNGDGKVDSLDIVPINLHYGKVHNKTGGITAGSGTPAIYVDSLKGPLKTGDTITFAINLGRDTLIADSVYGIAFTMHYDSSLVDSASLVVNFDSSWLGTPGQDLIHLQKDFFVRSEVDIALCRTDQQERSGHGAIAHVTIVMQDDIAGKTTIRDTLRINFSNIRMIKADGTIIPVAPEEAQVEVVQTPNRNTPITHHQEIRLGSNPNSQQITLFGELHNINQLALYSTTGQKLKSWQVNPSPTSPLKLQLPARLPAGIYLLHVQTGDLKRTFKFIKFTAP